MIVSILDGPIMSCHDCDKEFSETLELVFYAESWGANKIYLCKDCATALQDKLILSTPVMEYSS